jgi:DNA-binding MarR family transcriptional regulator
MSFPQLLLSNQLCFLVYRLDLAISARYRPLLAEIGLTYGQYLAMLALWEHRELEVGALCDLLGLDTGTVSPLVKRMEAAGLVERARRKDDERVVVVRLTEAGEILEEKARDVPAAIARCLIAEEKDYGRIQGMLRTMIARAEGKAGSVPGVARRTRRPRSGLPAKTGEVSGHMNHPHDEGIRGEGANRPRRDRRGRTGSRPGHPGRTAQGRQP